MLLRGLRSPSRDFACSVISSFVYVAFSTGCGSGSTGSGDSADGGDADGGKGAGGLASTREPVQIVDGFALEVSKPSPGDVFIEWASQGVSTYEVWTSADPYFAPGDAGSSMLASGSGLSYTASDGAEAYYRVVAEGAAEELSTTVGQLTYDLYPDYTKLGLCLVSEVNEWDELQADMPSSPYFVVMWDAAQQVWLNNGQLDDVEFGPGEVVSVYHGDPVTPDEYTAVGHVPTDVDVSIPLLPGDNLVTTLPLRFGPIYASDLLELVEHATRIGMWDSATQTETWYPDDSDFLLPTCSPVHVEVDDESSWPPPPASEIPPDPSEVAPALDTTVTTQMYAAVSFLFEGDPPIQEGVDPGTIEPERVSVLRGYVSERDGDALPGVLVSVLGHPEYGSTRTREDGRYDMAVNGGGPVVLSFLAEDMLPAQRTAHARWQDYTEVSDVALVPIDAEVSVIDFVDPIEVHVASTVIDADGTRTAALMFREGTVATMVMPDTSEDELTSISVRATEYTVGEDGRAAMPGDLPAASMYTYAVGYTIDEAEAAGAERVTFDPPAISYNENFVGFPVGEIVPVGSYDPARGAWIAEQNGRVIEVVGETGGLADLDLDGDGNADPGDYAAAGIDDDEREAVADLYGTGDELWRVELTHFSAWDYNWGWSPPPGAAPPPPGNPPPSSPPPDSCKEAGSILECQGQVMGERMPVVGTPFTLNYRSDRVPGRTASYTIDVPVTPSSLPSSLDHVLLRMQVAGRLIEQTLTPVVDQNVGITWDGLDLYGRRVQGTMPADLCVGYVYPISYNMPGGFATSAFGYNGNGVVITGERSGTDATLWRCYARGAVGGGMIPTNATTAQRALGWSNRYELGVWDARVSAAALGGWTLSVHHTLAAESGVVYRGDGSRQTKVETYNAVIQTVAGGGTTGTTTGTHLSALPIPALEADLGGNVSALAVGADGSLFLGRSDRVFRIAPDGVLSLFAGDGGSTVQGDGGPATSATIGTVWGLAVGPDESVYISAPLNGRIRRVGPDGTISTVAGNGTSGPVFGGDGDPATSASMNGVRDLAVAPDGTLFVAQELGTNGGRIRRITPDGTLTTFAGGSCTGGAIHGKLATGDCVFGVHGLARGQDGTIYFTGRDDSSSSTPTRVFRIDLDGRVAHIGGGGTPIDDVGDGLLATDARFYQAEHVAVSEEGLVYVADFSSPSGNALAGHRVRVIGHDGVIRTLAGRGFDSGCSDFDSEGNAADACLHRPAGIAVGPDNALYVAMRDEARIRRVSAAGFGWAADGRLVASDDHAELYAFDAQGRHEATLDALTGTTLWTFGYDTAGRLVTVTDAYSAVTQITRDGNGEATSIVSPDGLVTTLDVPEGGYLEEITNPESETHQFAYSSGGLLETHTTPALDAFSYDYDAGGRLIEASDPEGGSKSLSRQEVGPGAYEVTMTTELGRVSSYLVEDRLAGGEHRVNTQPDGTEIDVVRGADGVATVTYPGGTVVTQTITPDPRFGMQAPVRSNVLTTPGGRERVEASSRTVTLATEGDPLSMTGFVETYTLNGRTWTLSWDGTTDEVELQSPEGRLITTTLDAMGKTDTMQASTFAVLDVDYDARGRPEILTRGSGGSARVTEMAYDTDGFIESILDPANRVHGFAHDQAGRVALRTRPDLEVVTYSYDVNGNLDGITPPGQPEHEFGHDTTDRLTSYDPPAVTGVSTPGTSWTYTLDHEVDVITRPDAAEIAIVYGSTNGRLQEIVTPLGSYELTYDTAGRVDTFEDPFGGVLSYGYDGILRTSETLVGEVDGTVAWAYDDDLRVTSETVNGSSAITFGYDDDSVLTSAGAETLVPAAATGLVTDVLLVDSATAITYDEFGAPVTFTTEVDSTPIYDLDLGPRDALGRVVAMTETIGAATREVEYTYDSVGRLETVTEDSVLVATYAYDDNGNRTSVTTPGGTVSATYDDQDRLLTYGDLELAYNANGELYTRTDTVAIETTVYEYDVMGNLRSVELPDTTFIEYVTDARDRRVGRLVDGLPTHGWLYGDQLEPVAELDGTGALVSRFVYGYWRHVPDYMVRGGTTYRIVTDQVGSVRLVVNADTGAVAQRIDYDAWGNVLADTNPGFQPFGFAGGLYDPETGLVRFGARDYDASVGRWVSKDPILFGGRLTSLYSYCGADPASCVDNNGLAPGDPFPTPDAAARDWGEYHNDGSKRIDRERCGYIRRKFLYVPALRAWLPFYTYDEGYYGSEDSCTPWPLSPRRPRDYAGTCHTHGGNNPDYDNENFSPADRRHCGATGGPCWLFTPGDQCKKWSGGDGVSECQDWGPPRPI